MYSIRDSKFYSAILIIIGAIAGIIASLALSTEALWSAGHKGARFVCDVNAKVSCSTVAASSQSTLLHFGKYPVPNAFFGLIGFTALLCVAVMIMVYKDQAPSWLLWAYGLGCLLAWVFASWLFSQSVFVIKALCPWCLTMWFGTTLAASGGLRLLLQSQSRTRGFAHSLYSMLIPIIIIAGGVLIIMLEVM